MMLSIYTLPPLLAHILAALHSPCLEGRVGPVLKGRCY